ncbi:hypothetical protein [Glaciimonas sp. PAMC28666]|uniref:hypothetical protein n=1 Tax=Glaciimonas sp. PAMC28666 TaxID=2807626 RepID=UPI0019668C4E|nr:hypothetical protein [Glaciimonas sp. PAMC28666]QRX82231.1 hypothetical protein JQN73_19395 [Glaciimonas sp. PAMC28666]
MREINYRASVHLCPVAAYALIMFGMATHHARTITAQRKSRQIMCLQPCPLTVLMAIAVRRLGESFDSTTRARQTCHAPVVRFLNSRHHLLAGLDPLGRLLGTLEGC